MVRAWILDSVLTDQEWGQGTVTCVNNNGNSLHVQCFHDIESTSAFIIIFQSRWIGLLYFTDQKSKSLEWLNGLYKVTAGEAETLTQFFCL